VDEIYYSFYYFCPPAGTNPMPYWALPPYGSCTDGTEYTLMSVEPADAQYIPQIVGMKSSNPKLKVYLSIGGWNFPSNYFSKMVSSATSRTKFIQSVVSTLNQYNLDGIDIDWEYPCSAPRDNPVEISCDLFHIVHDNGGACPQDGTNLVNLVKELRTALGSKKITIASQAARANENNMDIPAVTPYIDKWHVMSYDYAVSDLPDPTAAISSPNCPLYMPDPPAVQMCMNQTIQDYLSVGVPPSKLMLGIALYGHTWYAPGLSNWQHYGVSGKVQGTCCGTFKQTYGAQPGKGCSLCGTMMYSEIQQAKPTTVYDKKTETVIGYWPQQGADGYTAAGTWVTYNDVQSVTAITKYGVANKLDGAFAFDTSMDSNYELINAIASSL